MENTYLAPEVVVAKLRLEFVLDWSPVSIEKPFSPGLNIFRTSNISAKIKI